MSEPIDREPVRWADDPDAPEGAAAAIRSARTDGPSHAQLESLAARLGPLLGPPSGPGGGSHDGGGGGDGPSGGPSTIAGGVAKAATVLGLVGGGALIAAVGLWAGSRTSAPEAVDPRGAARPVAEASPGSSEAGAPIPSGMDPPDWEGEGPAPTPGPRPGRSRSAEPAEAETAEAEPAEAETAEAETAEAETADPQAEPADPQAELALIRQAQRALAGDPGLALSLAEQHQARFPDGVLAQEREVVWVDAASRLGRPSAARARAEAFRRRWPRSAHRRRLDVILERGAPE